MVFEMVRSYLHSARGRQRVTIGDGMFDRHAPELRWDVRWARGGRCTESAFCRYWSTSENEGFGIFVYVASIFRL